MSLNCVNFPRQSHGGVGVGRRSRRKRRRRFWPKLSRGNVEAVPCFKILNFGIFRGFCRYRQLWGKDVPVHKIIHFCVRLWFVFYSMYKYGICVISYYSFFRERANNATGLNVFCGKKTFSFSPFSIVYGLDAASRAPPPSGGRAASESCSLTSVTWVCVCEGLGKAQKVA